MMLQINEGYNIYLKNELVYSRDEEETADSKPSDASGILG